MEDKILYQAVVANADLKVLVGDRIYPRGSLGQNNIPASPQLPFIMYGEEERTPELSVRETAPGMGTSLWDVYVYDKPGSYIRIKRILRLLEQTWTGVPPSKEVEGSRILECVLVGESRDQYDQVQNQAVKSATFRVTSQY